MPLACLTQLDRSHRRHDDVMAQLLEAARRLAAGRPHDTDLDAVHDAIRYFERAVTRHFLDEEGSVFPRLSTRRPDLAEVLADLSAEHPQQIALQHAVADAATQLDDESRPGAGKALLEAAERLAEQHRSHVAREDEIFASAHEALTAQDDADIVAEMETRRDRDSEDGQSHIRQGGGGVGGGGGGVGGGGGGVGGGGAGGGRGARGGRRSDVGAIAEAAVEVAKVAASKLAGALAKRRATKSTNSRTSVPNAAKPATKAKKPAKASAANTKKPAKASAANAKKPAKASAANAKKPAKATKATPKPSAKPSTSRLAAKRPVVGKPKPARPRY